MPGIAMFLDLTGPNGAVAGSCTDEQFKGKIELLSCILNVTAVPRTRSKPKNQAPDAVQVDEEGKQIKPPGRKDDSFTVTKVVDVASPTLLTTYCQHLQPDGRAKEFPKAVITYRLMRNASPHNLLVLTFTGLFLIDYQLESIDDKTTHPTEKLSFSYKTLTLQYTREPVAAGDVPAPRSISWNRAARQT